MPAWFYDHLACPDCQRPLAVSDGPACVCGFAVDPAAPNDFRPRRPVRRTLSFDIGSKAQEDLTTVRIDRPAITYRGPLAIRDSRELFSAAEPWLKEGQRLLDLGCGPRDQAAPAAAYGLQYAGVDFNSPAADLLADAHSVPFQSETFDAVFAYAVLEHLYNPFVAVSEIARLLKPGGIFFGTVSQGEPFHESYFHHTALGVLSLLRGGGLRVARLWPIYDTLHALSTMGRYPRLQQLLIESVYRIGKALPILAPRKFFKWPERDKQLDEIHRAAGLCFVAEKPGGLLARRETEGAFDA